MITPAQAAEALLKRRQTRSSLDEWAKVCGYIPAKHHSYINSKLEAVERGEIRKLMIFLPPGSAKSTYASVLFPPWYLSHKTGRTILACSASKTLVEGFGRRCRNLVFQKANELNYTVNDDSRAAGEWETSNGGRYFCAGAGADIAGHRADLGLIDDPVGSREAADSPTEREKIWQWYINDFKPRLKPNAAQILIMTRWHEDDLAGRLLDPKRNEHKGWEVIKLPFYAIVNDPLGRAVGERLWPDWFQDEMFSTDARTANSLYQCSPTVETGNFFQKESFIGYSISELPLLEELSIYVSSDHALGKKEDNDFTVMIPWGVDPTGTIWMLPDIVWEQLNGKEAVDAMFAMMERRSPLYWWAGKDHIETAIGPFLKARMWEEQVFSCLVSVAPGRFDKRIRAQSIKGMMDMGRVRVPKFTAWWPKAEAQLLAFDASDEDDFVDACAVFGQGLASVRRGMKREERSRLDINADFRPTYGWMLESDENVKREKMMASFES